MGKDRIFILIVLGVILGTFIFLSPATFLMSVIILIIGIGLWNLNLPKEEKHFLLKIFTVGILIRIFICLLIYFVSVAKGGEGSLFQDDVGQPRNAWLVYQSWLGKFDINAYRKIYTDGLGVGVRFNENEHYLLLISLIYSVIRYFTPLIAKFINIILGSLIPIFIYAIAKEAFDKKIARLSAFSLAFFPSLILWSIAALKDIPCTFLVILAILLYMKRLKKKSLLYLLFILITIVSLYSIRKDLAMLVIFTFSLSSFIYLRISWFKKMTFILLLWLCFISIFPYKFRVAISNLFAKFSVNSLLLYHKGYATSGGNVYKIMDESIYLADEINLNFLQKTKAILKGTFYFMLVPFPWSGKNLWQVVSIPQIILWYFFLPFFFIGAIFILRHRFREFMPIVFFLALAIFTMSLYEGNVGTAVRHRDLITPFYIVFSLVGLKAGYRFLKSV